MPSEQGSVGVPAVPALARSSVAPQPLGVLPVPLEQEGHFSHPGQEVFSVRDRIPEPSRPFAEDTQCLR